MWVDVDDVNEIIGTQLRIYVMPANPISTSIYDEFSEFDNIVGINTETQNTESTPVPKRPRVDNTG